MNDRNESIPQPPVVPRGGRSRMAAVSVSRSANSGEASRQVFRFVTSSGQLLSQRIAEIENMATQRLREGGTHDSVQKGAMSLLGIAVAGVCGQVKEEC